MNIAYNNLKSRRMLSAFSLAETVVALAVLAIMFAAFFGGLSLSLSVVQAARETSRATEIMSESMETIRLASWDKVVSSNFIAPFKATANVQGAPGYKASSLMFTVKVGVADASIGTITNGESYRKDVKEVTINVKWRSRKLVKETEMKTFFSRYGLQTYVP